MPLHNVQIPWPVGSAFSVKYVRLNVPQCIDCRNIRKVEPLTVYSFPSCLFRKYTAIVGIAPSTHSFQCLAYFVHAVTYVDSVNFHVVCVSGGK